LSSLRERKPTPSQNSLRFFHWKSDSADITQGDIDAIFNSMFGCKEKSADPRKEGDEGFLKNALMNVLPPEKASTLKTKSCLSNCN